MEVAGRAPPQLNVQWRGYRLPGRGGAWPLAILGEGVTAGGSDGDDNCRSSSARAWSGGVRREHLMPQAAVNPSAKAAVQRQRQAGESKAAGSGARDGNGYGGKQATSSKQRLSRLQGTSQRHFHPMTPTATGPG